MGMKLRFFFTRILLLLFCSPVLAQGPGGPGPPPPVGLPMLIDDHIYILVFFGVILGFYFIYKKKKQALS